MPPSEKRYRWIPAAWRGANIDHATDVWWAAHGFQCQQGLPKAQFLHAKEPKDMKKEHLEGIVTIILVNYMINSDGSMVQFV